MIISENKHIVSLDFCDPPWEIKEKSECMGMQNWHAAQ